MARQLAVGVLFGGDSIPRQYFDEQVRMVNAGALSAINNLLVPRTLRVNNATFERILDTASSLTYPILIRPAGQHGGKFSGRFGSPEQLAKLQITANSDYYLTEFRNYCSEDGKEHQPTKSLSQ